MAEDLFEKQLRSVQVKRSKKEQQAAFRKIDAIINQWSEQWIACIFEDMEATIAQEPDPEKRKVMEEARENYLNGFEVGYYAGWLRQRADEV